MGARSRIARWKASQNDFQALKGAFRNLVLVRAAQLSRVIARHTGERRVDVYERLITRWTEPLDRTTGATNRDVAQPVDGDLARQHRRAGQARAWRDRLRMARRLRHPGATRDLRRP